eukprot:scaffold6126_cov131-Isochrysis_galbana.AAC.2
MTLGMAAASSQILGYARSLCAVMAQRGEARWLPCSSVQSQRDHTAPLLVPRQLALQLGVGPPQPTRLLVQ